MAGLHFPITADNSSFIRALHEVSAGVRDASRQIESDGGSIDKTISRIKTGIASIGAGWGFKEVSSAVANTRGEFQQLEVAFKTMLGSEEKAATLMNQLVRTAAITPFDLQGVANGAKQLLAYGVSADEVNKRLTQLGDIASGLSIPLNDLVYLYGTTITQGKMFTQDLRQFQGRGIPIADELAKQFGVAKEKVGELVTAGKVGSKEFIAAIDAMTAPGSKFGGLMEEQSKTISGQISNIEDAFDTMLNDIGKSQQGLISGTLDVTSTLIENWQTVLAILGDITAAYGVQKAMLALDAGFTKAATNYGYDAEIEQLKALIPLKEEEKATALQQAVASGNLTEAKAAEIKSLREEAEAYVATLAAKQAEAKQAEIVAQANLTTALQEKSIADDMVQTAQERWKAAYDSADAVAEEAAAIELETAKSIQSEAADAVATATKEAKAASSAHVAAQQATETASTQINTAQTAGNSAATGVLTIAKEKLAIAIGKVNAAIKANQFAIITGAIIAMGYAVYKLITYQTDYEKSLDRLDEAHKKAQSNYIAEGYAIDRLFDKLAQAKKGTKEWEEARDAIWSKYGQYLKSLGDEKTALNDVATAYNLVKQEAEKAAKARALNSFVESEGQTHAEKMGDLRIRALDMVESRYGKDFRLKHAQDIIGLVEGTATATEKFMSKMNTKDGFFGRAGNFSRLLAEASLERENFQKVLGKAEEKFSSTYTKTQNTDPKVKEKTLAEVYNEAAKNYKDAQNKVEEMKKNRSAYTEKQWEEAQQKLKDSKEAYEKAGGETKAKSGPTSAQIESKQTDAHQKLIDLMKQQAEERLLLQQEYEMELWQNRINLMEDGEAKVLEQMKLDQAKEKYSLEQRKKQAIEAEVARQKAIFDARQDELAAGDKKYAKQVFNPGENIAETVEELSKIEDAISKAQEELDKLIETEGSKEEVDKCKDKIREFVEQHKKLSSKMGDVTDTEVKKILSRYESLYEDLGKMQDKSYSDRIQSAEKSLNEYLAKYGSYEQKRYALAKEWDEKIKRATPAERPMLEAGKREAESDLDFNEWKKSGEIAKAFGDIKKLSASTVKDLIKHMEQYRGKVIDTFDPEKIKEYEDALRDLKNLDIDNSLGIFANFVPEPFKEAAKYEAEMVEREKQMTALFEKRNQIQNSIIQQQAGIVTTANNQGVKVSIEDLMGPDAFDVVSKKFADAGKQMGEGLQSQLSQLTGSMGELGGMSDMIGQMGDMGEMGGGMMQSLQFVDAIVHAINDTVQSLKELIDDLRNTADALGADTEVGSNWAQASTIMDGFAEASQGATDAFEAFKSGNGMGVIQGVVKSFTSWIRAFAAFNDAKHERKILELQDRIDDLKESYDDLGKTVDDYFSIDAADILEQQNELIRQQNELVRQQMKEEEAKKNSDDEKMEEYRKQLKANEELLKENEKKAKEAIIGKDIKSAIEEFTSKYAEAWDDGTDAAQKSMAAVKSIISSALTELLKKTVQPAAQRFYDTLVEAMKDGILTEAELASLDAIKAQMDALAATQEEQYKEIQERYKDIDELREELTDISFDSVRDNFKSLLTDMESSTEDFADNFSEMLRNALVEGLMDSKYDALLKEWYAAFAEAMDDQRLTDEERERLRQQYDAIVQQGIADRNAINDIVGGGAYSQQASKGEAWGMNQETGEELNGRFTAMVELEATNNVLVADGNATAREILIAVKSMTGMSMTTSGSDNKDTLLAIKDMIFLSTGYLEDIAKYSKNLVEINTEIVNIKNYIKDL